MTLTELEAIAKQDEVVCDVQIVQNGEDMNGFPTFKNVFVNNPLHYQVIYIDPITNLALLKDLDYVAPTA